MQKKVLRIEMYKHSYPHCYRTDTPLIYKAITSHFIKVTKIKDKLIENNKKTTCKPHRENNVSLVAP